MERQGPNEAARGTETVRDLKELRRQDLALAGGKACSLGEMIHSGLPVPEGFAVLTGAYRAFVDSNGLQTEISRLAGATPAEDMEALEEASAAIRRLFDAGTLPKEVHGMIAQCYEALGGGAVAVRSSATAEDLPDASFAGQHDSYLHVDGADAVSAAVKSCWASLWNQRALSYRRRRGMHVDDVAMSVIVQRMVTAERAGVLFTANPLNHRRDRMLLSASWGLGEAVVGGEVTPDQWVVDAETGAVLEERIADKRLITVKDAGGTALRDMPSSLREKPTLNAREIRELAALGRKAASFFGQPQDIEWAWAEGRFHLVQSRPITALFPLPEPQPDPSKGLRLYLCFSVHAQQMVEPMTPMGLEFWRALLREMAFAATGRLSPEVPWYKVAAGRMFADVTELLRNPKSWARFGQSIGDKDPITTEALDLFLEREGEAIAHKGSGFGMSTRLASFLARLGFRALLAALEPAGARKRLRRETTETITELEAEVPGLKGVTERVWFIEERLCRRGSIFWLIPVAVMWPGYSAEAAIRARLRQWLGDETPFLQIQRALPHNPTTEMGLDLWRLAQNLKAEGVEPAVSHPGVAEFLAFYGHRAVWEIDPGVPRWSEDPAYILDVLRNYMDQLDQVDQERQFQAYQREARESAEALVDRVRREKGRRQAWMLRRLIRLYRELGGLREQPKFDGARIVALARRVLRDAGRELVARGHLGEAEEVFFLTFDDLRAADAGREVDLRARASEGRAVYQREMERKKVPRWMTSTGECIFGVPRQDSEEGLAGLPVSPGVYEGRARVISHPKGARLEQGEVLVCRGTDPAWTPLFLRAGALVMETGGAVSHGSVVAREYGLPAVAGVEDATERLRDGFMVRVDGDTGLVTVLG
jgi:rifampicin phosphotransferase